MATFLQSKGIQHGIFIDGLPNYTTQEILWMELKERQKIEGLKIVKLPRDFNTQVFKGYAFVGFQDRQTAIQAKKQLNFIEFRGKKEHQLRVALIVADEEKNAECNLIITNLPKEVTPKEFDQRVNEFGATISTKIQQKEDGSGKGFAHVQFLNVADSTKFRNAAEKKEIKFGGADIEVHIFKKHESQPQEKKNMYFRDFKDVYTKEQMANGKFKETETVNITNYLKEKLGVYGEVQSYFVSFSKDFNLPYAIVCFKNATDAQKCFDTINGDEEFKFAYKTWSLPTKVRKELQEHNRDKRYIYIKNIKRNVSQEQLFKVLHQISKVQSIKLKQPTISKFKTNFATVILEEENKLDFVKNNTKEGPHKNQEFIDLFDRSPYISYLFPRKSHAQFVKASYQRSMQQGFQPQFQRGNFPPMPPMMGFPPMGMMPNMMPNMMPPMFPPRAGAPPMGMGFQQGMPPMFNQNMMFAQQMPSQAPPGIAPQGQFPGLAQGQPPMMNAPMQQNRAPQQNNRQGRYQDFNQQRSPNKQQYQNNRGPHQNNNRGPGGRGGQGRPVNQNRPQYQPKAVQPKQYQGGQQGVRPQQQQQQAPQSDVMTTQKLKARWDDFMKQDQGRQKQILGTMLFPRIQQLASDKAQVKKITGMLLDFDVLTQQEILVLIDDQKDLKERVQEAEELLTQQE